MPGVSMPSRYFAPKIARSIARGSARQAFRPGSIAGALTRQSAARNAFRPGGLAQSYASAYPAAGKSRLGAKWAGLGKWQRRGIIAGGVLAAGGLISASGRSSGSLGLQPRSSGGNSLYMY